MNADDEPVRLNKIGLSEGVADFYDKIDPKFKFRLKFDWMWNFNEGFAIVKLNYKYNFINTEGRILSKQWFDAMEGFNDGFAKVKLNGQYNFIDTNGQLLLQQWFDDIFEFNNYFTSVQLNSKLKPIYTNGIFFKFNK